MTTRTCEYVWVDPKGPEYIRSKTKISPTDQGLEIWSFDGSSTGYEVPVENSELFLEPGKVYEHPFRDTGRDYFTICSVHDTDMKPLCNSSNLKILDKKHSDKEFWASFEQEYFIYSEGNPINWTISELSTGVTHHDKLYYCGNIAGGLCRRIAEEHMSACIKAGIKISGINAEVAKSQWEFQIGPSNPQQAADDLIAARYLLLLICDKYNVRANFDPKPLTISDVCSGCHINFSDKNIRTSDMSDDFLQPIMDKFERAHDEHIAVCGVGNEFRLSGRCETSSRHKFTWGRGDRTASIRIPKLSNYGNGYLEDRRPGSNIDPHLALSSIMGTLYS